MPELPASLRARLSDTTPATAEDASTLIERGLAGLVLDAVEAGADPTRALTHAVQNLAVEGAEGLDPAAFASLVTMETSGQLTATQAKQVLADLVEQGGDPAAIAAARGFEAMDTSELESLVAQAIEANPDAWEKYCAGEDKVQGVFVGAVMKATRGQADGKAVNEILRSRRG
jgi:aspartyl-tRNA(Asn)/glutamyl-tRNA(Gln) amidotransferase subunit B